MGNSNHQATDLEKGLSFLFNLTGFGMSIAVAVTSAAVALFVPLIAQSGNVNDFYLVTSCALMSFIGCHSGQRIGQGLGFLAGKVTGGIIGGVSCYALTALFMKGSDHITDDTKASFRHGIGYIGASALSNFGSQAGYYFGAILGFWMGAFSGHIATEYYHEVNAAPVQTQQAVYVDEATSMNICAQKFCTSRSFPS